MAATQSQINRLQRFYSQIAGEQVTVEQIGCTIYTFGSEVATLRLFRKMPNGRQEFSKNMGTHFFAVDVSA